VRALLDVNMLLALFDAQHIHHARAFGWWSDNRQRGWASCPLTQNGFVRVISGPRYRHPRSIADALAMLHGQVEQPGHEFWSDDLSIVERMFDRRYLLGPKQITDAYLFALAIKNGGRLATLDQGVPLRVLRGAETKHLVVIN
jgi:toxin-antitoxin system PIN domain toxin